MALTEIDPGIKKLFGVQVWGKDGECRTAMPGLQLQHPPVGQECGGTWWVLHKHPGHSTSGPAQSHPSLWRSPGHAGTRGGLGFFSYWLWKPHLSLHPRGQVWTSPASWRLTRLHPQALAHQGFKSRLQPGSCLQRRGKGRGGWCLAGAGRLKLCLEGEDAYSAALIPLCALSCSVPVTASASLLSRPSAH